MKLVDCHTHTKNSEDAYSHATTKAMCERALELQLAAYAITDHCEAADFYRLNYVTGVEKSLSEVTALKEAYQNRLQLICGVEIGQANQCLSVAEQIVADTRLDYVIGSVHNLRGKTDFAFLDYETEDIDFLLHTYYDEMIELCQWGKFDILAHITYPLRYITGEHGIAVDMSRYEKQICQSFALCIDKGIGLEINTSGLRQPYGKTFPDLDYIRLFRSMGGKLISVGSDAHRPEDLGKGIIQGLSLAKQAGFEQICYFIKRQPHFLPIP